MSEGVSDRALSLLHVNRGCVFISNNTVLHSYDRDSQRPNGSLQCNDMLSVVVSHLVCLCADHAVAAGEHGQPLHPAMSQQSVGHVVVLYFPPVHFEL